MNHSFRTTLLIAFTTLLLCGCKVRFKDPEKFQTPELFFENAIYKENCSVASSTYKNKESSPDYNWTMKNACLGVEEYIYTSKFDKPDERSFTYKIFRNYTTSGANYVTRTIWDDGHLMIDHVVALTGHTYFYFTLDDVKAKELNDLAETMVLYAENEAYKAEVAAEKFNTVENYCIKMETILPVDVKLIGDEVREFKDNGELLNVIKDINYSKTTQETGYFSDIKLWYNSDYYSNNEAWIMFLNEDGDKVILQYLYFDSLGRGYYHNAYYSLAARDGLRIITKASEMAK